MSRASLSSSLRRIRQPGDVSSRCPIKTSTTETSRPGDLVSEENKQQITLRLDAEVLAFFKAAGKKYQSRIHAALREFMLAHWATTK